MLQPDSIRDGMVELGLWLFPVFENSFLFFKNKEKKENMENMFGS